MKDTVILFHPRTFHERNYRYFHVPYSLLSVAANIDRERFNILLLDNNVLNREDFMPEIESLRDRLLCVGVSSMIGHQIADGLQFAQTVRATRDDIPIVWGGALPTVLPDLTVRHDLIDIVVRGQGQETFPELLDALFNRLPLDDVSGLDYKTGREVCRTPERLFADINRFSPYRHVYDLINPAGYIRYDEHIHTRTISYHSSQGCPFKCGFCSETALWKNRWTGFTPERILGDVEYLIDRFGINGIKFYDAEFFINPTRALTFAQEVIDRRLPIRWGAAVHPRNLDRLDEAQFALLRASGASRFLMGAESGVEEELDLVGKRTSREMLLRLARRCADHDISASFSFVTGYPGMPDANIQASLDFASELAGIASRHEIKLHFFAPYPGTPLYPFAIQHGFVPPQTLDDWSLYDYYDVTTPWVDRKWEPIVREFNERLCPYYQPVPVSADTHLPLKLCPLL